MDVGVLVSMIAAIAAIIAPVLTAIITQRGARRIKQIEMFFLAKAQTYNAFLDVTSQFPPNPQYEDLRKLSLVFNQALLYSSRETGRKLALYVNFLKNGDVSDAESAAYLDAVSALKAELIQYQK